MNSLLVGYLIVNSLMIICLLRSKMKVMRVTYLVALILLLFVLLASDKNSFVAHLITDAYGSEIYVNIYESTNYPIIAGLSAVSIIQLLVIMSFFAVSLFIAIITVEIVRLNLREEQEIKLKKPVKNLRTQVVNITKFNTKIYLTNCVMLC